MKIKNIFLAHSTAMISLEDGINEYRLCAALTFLLSKKIISGKYGFVCQFEKKLNFDTIWSCVYDLNSLYNEICEGNPSENRYSFDNRLKGGLKQNDNIK